MPVAAPPQAAATPPAAPAPAAATPYRVLARKYRPQNFDDLIGQEAMVRTLSNAFASGRIAQAYILTGVRGVGKTTTARILARALNYEPMEGGGGPSLDLSVLGKHCKDIIESRHVDVMEMDAASNTSINDIREIIDGSRYRPVMARYKVYIIDEVHMLSTAAFNGLLKTLEEPPEHVKFIFATTEIRKVPVTVLSRCQRFDLRRVEAGTLASHLSKICAKEDVTVDAEALSIVSRAAEGSVRDSLSLLDQAIAHGGGTVSGEEIRRLLGLADKARVIDLFDALMRGDMPRALGEFRDQYDAGADPAVILTDLAEFTHLVTRLKIVPSSAEDASLVEAERLRGKEMAEGLSMRVLSRTWQMLSKGITEVQQAAKPAQAAEMVLVRLAYASDLPTPDETLRKLKDMPTDGGSAPGPSSGGGAPPPGPVAMAAGGGGARLAIAARSEPMPQRAPQPAAVAGPQLRTFADVVALAVQKRDLLLKHALETNARLVHFEEGRIELAITEGGDPNLVQTLARKLLEWTSRRWLVSLSSKQGAATIAEVAQARREEREDGIRADPLVAAVLAHFPGAQITDVRTREDVAVEALAPMEETGADDGSDDDEGLSPFD
ncbi:DNA polymerase III subunit gamma/tau [Azorhizobium oxalatiphilum]|uniref:DNA polymerase III subunit gamma/tau n=1 Tax=Azorhizobium oxalatiphilum TaxID=980631 RepID=A0A917FFP3_9HYPH|nr:DNA polymerase III subunit gamma/tau [Azorhizobium oxalatiphilum]